MSYTDLLQIYDADDLLTRSTGAVREADKVIGIKGGVKGLMSVLDRFVAEKRVFGRVVFHTHGNDGSISFGDEKGNKQITTDVLNRMFAGRKYDTLFTYNARIYFNGCKVAAGDVGWKFLETAGSVFLGRLGGTTFGHTKYGRPLVWDFVTVFGGVATQLRFWNKRGHAVHLNGETRYVYTVPGGHASSKWTD